MSQPKKKMHTILLLLWVLLISGLSWTVDAPALEMEEGETIQLVRGKSMLLKQPEPAKRVSIADPAIADFVLFSHKSPLLKFVRAFYFALLSIFGSLGQFGQSVF